jgi:hypothetical protein
MKVLAVICLVVLASSIAISQTGGFAKARHIGEGTSRSFFLFLTSAGKYTIRHDGFGEVAASGKRKEVFFSILSPGSRLERVYFSEYEGDLLLLYEVREGRSSGSCLLRMNQQTRKVRWLKWIQVDDNESCVVEGDEVHCGAPDNLKKFDLKTGKQLNQTSSSSASSCA